MGKKTSQTGAAVLLELADRLWQGDEPIEEHHPVGYTGQLAVLAEGTASVPKQPAARSPMNYYLRPVTTPLLEAVSGATRQF